MLLVRNSYFTFQPLSQSSGNLEIGIARRGGGGVGGETIQEGSRAESCYMDLDFIINIPERIFGEK